MKYLILKGNEIIKTGHYNDIQLNRFKKLGFVVEEKPSDYPRGLRKWEVKKSGNKYIEKTEEEKAEKLEEIKKIF